MSETVDTRVVEARFDSKQFEQGVDKTVKKLDELKKSLTDATTGKTVAEIGNKVQDATDKASNSLEKLQNRFTSFTGMLKQKLLSGIADEIVSVFFRIKSSFESMVTSLSTAQIGVGMQRYTDILTSVRTLVSAGVNQGKAYEAIGRLGEYADQTSYSLDSMVATMSKFKTAGADINTAARMIEGLSNAAASMGVNAQQAERAYLNLQQAYSKKVMLQNDWMSFESIPMVGEKFNQAIIDAAVKVGTLRESKAKAKIDPKVKAELEKQLKEGILDQEGYNAELEKLRNAKTYETVKKSGTKIRSAKGITASNMGSNLTSRWFTDEVMEEVFGNTYYFAEVGIDELNKIKKIEKRLKEQFGNDEEGFNTAFQEELNERAQERRIEKIEELDEALKKGTIDAKEYKKQLAEFDKSNILTVFGYECLRAGQEARSFTDVINTLKDVISRGWAKSFELIFGQLDEAADFFTKLTESNLAEGIYAISEFRNAVLQSWRDTGGRDNLLGVLEQLDNIAGSIWEKFGLIRDSEKWFEEHFDQDLYDRILNESTGGGKEAAERYKQSIMDEANASPFERKARELGQRLAILTRNIRDFFKRVHNWFIETDSTGTSRLQRITNILDVFGQGFNGAMTLVGMGLKFVGNTYNTFKTVFDKLWEAIDKILTPISNLLNPDYKVNGKNAYTDVQNVLNNIGKVAEKIADPLAKVVEVLGDVATFFMDLTVGTFTSNLTFFSDAFGLLLELLGLGSSQADDKKQGSVAKGIAKDITDLGDACKDAFQAVSDFFSSVIADIRTWLGLSDQTTEGGNIFTNIANWWNTDESLQVIKKSIDDFVAKVGDWFAHIPENVSKFAIDIGDFFKSLLYKKKTTTISQNTTIVEWVKTDLLLWIEKAVADIKQWFADLPNNISDLVINIGDFFKSLFYTQETKYNGSMLETKWVKKEITVELENFLIELGDWFKDIPNKIRGLFYKEVEVEGKRGGKVKTTIETPLKQWLDKAILDAKNFIKDIPNKLKKIPSLFTTLLNTTLFKETKTTSTGPNNKVTYTVSVTLKTFLTNLINEVKKFVSNLPMHIHNAIAGVGDFITMVWDALTGNDQGTSSDAAQNAADNAEKSINNSFSNISISGALESIKNLGKKIWNGILTIFTGNPDVSFNNSWLSGQVSDGIAWISKNAEIIWNTTSDFIVNLPGTIAGLFDEKNTDAGEDGTVKSAIIKFGERIGVWISSIPDKALTAWKGIEKLSGTLWNKIISWITGSGQDTKNLKFTYEQQEIINRAPEEAKKSLEEHFAELNWRNDNPIAANISDFFEHIKNYIVERITHLPEDIASGLATGASLLQNLLDTATGWFNSSNQDSEARKKAQSKWLQKWIPFDNNEMMHIYNKSYKEARAFISTRSDDLSWIDKYASDRAEEAAKAYKDKTRESSAAKSEWASLGLDTGESPLLEALSSFGSTIWTLITETIPGFISSGFTWIKDNAVSWYESLKGLFNGGEKEAENEVNSFASKITDFIKRAFAPNDFNKHIYNGLLNAHEYEDAALYKQQHTNPIVQFFQGVVDTVGDIFADIGPKIVDGINKAFNFIGDGLSWATKHLQEAVSGGKTITEIVEGNMVDPTGEESKWAPLWEAVKGVGRTIKHIIIDVIPDFITSAASYIGQRIPELLSGIFGGGSSADTEQQVKESAKELGTTLGGFNEEVYKHYLEVDSSGYAAKKYKESFEKSGNELIDYYEAMAEQYGMSIEEVKQNMEKNGNKGFDILSLVFPSVNAESMTLDKSTKKAEGLIGTFGGFIDNIKGKFKDAAEVIRLISGGNKSEDSAKNSEGIFGGITGFINNLTSSFKDAKEDTLLKVGVILALAALVIHKIHKVTDDLFFLDDAIGWNAKWIGLGAVMTAISGIIAWCVYLASTGDQNKLNAVYGVFDKLISVLQEITKMATQIIGMFALKKSFGAIESLFDFLESKTLAKLEAGGIFKGGFISGFIKRIITFLGISEGIDIITTGIETGIHNLAEAVDAIASTTDSIKKIVNDILEVKDDINPAIEAIKDVGALFNAFRDIFSVNEITSIQDISPDKERAGQYFIGANGAFQFLAEGEDATLETISEAEYLAGTKGKKIEVITKSLADEYILLARMMVRLSGAVAEFKNSLVISKDVTTITEDLRTLLGMTSEMKTFADFGKSEDFSNFKTAFSSFGAALNLFSFGEIKTENFDSSIINTAVSLLSELFGNTELQDLVSNLTDTGLPEGNELLEKSERMVIFAGALASIARACKELNDDSGDNIKKLFETVSKIPTTEYNGKRIDELSAQFGELGNAMGSFAFETSALNNTNVENARTALQMILDLAVGLKDIPDNSAFAKIFIGDKTLDSFALGIETLGRHLSAFFRSIENIKADGKSQKYNTENLEIALGAMLRIAKIYSVFLNNANTGYAKNIGDYFGDLSGVGQSIMSFLNDIATSEYADTVKSFDFTQITEFFAGLGEMIGAMEASLHIPAELLILSSQDEIATTAFGSILSILTSVYDNISTINNFLDAVGEIELSKISKAKDLFGALADLAYTLTVFSGPNEKNGFASYAAGLENLSNFDFDKLATIAEQLDLAYGRDNELITPKITPVLELTDFEKEAQKMWDMLGVTRDSEGKLVQPSLSINISGVDLPQLTEIDRKLEALATINSTVGEIKAAAESFNDSLSKTAFVISGERLTETIGPTMDKWLGQEACYVVRATLTNG